MLNELEEVFELANNTTSLIADTMKLTNCNNGTGDFAPIGNSDNWARIASSDNWVQIGSSGDYAQIASSGDDTQIVSSGNNVQIASSSGRAQIVINGSNAVVSGIGRNTMIKGRKGTWITLAEYDEQENPICVKSGIIDGEKNKSRYLVHSL